MEEKEVGGAAPPEREGKPATATEREGRGTSLFASFAVRTFLRVPKRDAQNSRLCFFGEYPTMGSSTGSSRRTFFVSSRGTDIWISFVRP